MSWSARSRGRSAATRARVQRTPAELVRTAGRAALWCVVAVLLVRGAADVLASDERPPAVVRQAPAASTWPDDAARAFAVEFARAYLSYSPRRPTAYARSLARFIAPELAASVVPELPERASAQVVQGAVVSGVRRLDDRRALVTVAASVATGTVVSSRQLTVPVARGEAGGLVVFELPSLAAPTLVGQVPEAEGEPVTGDDRAELEDVLALFFRAFLAGDGERMAFAVEPGVRLEALDVPHELVAIESVVSVPSRPGARSRSVLVGVRAREARSGATFALAYRVELVRGDRLYVADVNAISEMEAGR